MKRIVGFLSFCILVFAITGFAFDGNNVVVCRISGGGVGFSASVFLDEYTPGGSLVQSIPMSANSSNAPNLFTDFSVEKSGDINSADYATPCLLNLSADRRYLLLGGYEATANQSQIATTEAMTISRIILRVNGLEKIDHVHRIRDGFSGTQFDRGAIRSVASIDGTQFWVSGTGLTDTAQPSDGIRYIGAATADGQSSLILNQSNTGGLYLFDAGGQQGLIQTVLSTPNNGFFSPQRTIFYLFPFQSSPQNLTPFSAWTFEQALGGVVNPQFSWVSPAIVILSINNQVVMYVAEQNSRVSGVVNVIHKYVLGFANSWNYKGSSSGVPALWHGLTGRVNANQEVELFGTTSQSLFLLTDASGINGNIDGLTPQSIAMVPNQGAFQGIAFTPAHDFIFKNGFE